MPRPAVDVSSVKSALDQFLVDVQHAQNDAIVVALNAAEAAGQVAVRAQTKRRTGALADGFQKQQTNNFSGRLINKAKHAGFINDGTVPHEIRPKRKRFLAFSVGGAKLFRRVVNHPGTEPRPFVPQAELAGERVLQATLQSRVDAAASKV